MDQPKVSIVRLFPTLRYDYDVTSELCSHKSKQNSFCLYSGNAKKM